MQLYRLFFLIFDKFSTENGSFNIYKEKNLIINPKEATIGHKFVDKFLDEGLQSDRISLMSSFIPLKWSLQCLLESKGVFKLLTDNMEKLYSETSGIITNQIQAQLWKNIIKNMKGKFVIPINIFVSSETLLDRV